MKSVTVVSGGMDSITLAYQLAAQNVQQILVSFDYGQRHKKELEYAALCATALGVPHKLIDLSSLAAHLHSSSLTSEAIPVPDGHYAEETMRITVVPNRNAIMLAIAYGIAVAEQFNMVSIGVHSGDHFIYPDCRPAFIYSFAAMQQAAIEGFGSVVLHAPFLEKTKAEIVLIAQSVAAPLQDSWSCYKGGHLHCGKCGTCTERKEAFELALVFDPTEYED